MSENEVYAEATENTAAVEVTEQGGEAAEATESSDGE